MNANSFFVSGYVCSLVVFSQCNVPIAWLSHLAQWIVHFRTWFILFLGFLFLGCGLTWLQFSYVRVLGWLRNVEIE